MALSLPKGLDLKEFVEEKTNVKMEDFFESTIKEYDEFDEYCWNRGEGYKIPMAPMATEKIEGLEPGMYLFAGESNTGKTAIMMNLLYSIATHPENNLYGVYYSLDDSKYEIIPRVIAMNERIPIGVCAKPERYKVQIAKYSENAHEYDEWLERREEGIKRLKANSEYFKIVDSNTIKSAEALHEHIGKIKKYIKAQNPDANIIVAIDALNDIRFKEKNLSPGVELHSEIAKTIKGWAVEYDIPIFGSCHLRKLNAMRRPVLDDLKESGEYVYESSVVWLVYNDVGKNKQGATIYYHEEGRDDKRPVIELDWAKNKKSSFKGRTYYYFVDNMSRATECDEEVTDRFNTLIYES